MRKILDWLIDKWLAGFLTGSFFFVLKLYFDLPKAERPNFFSFAWLRTLVHYPIQLWHTIIVILFVIVMFQAKKYWTIFRRSKSTKETDISTEPAMQYREDVFGTNNARWVWDYNWDGAKKLALVKDVTPLCPICGSPGEIDRRPYSTNNADCHRCRLEGRNPSFDLQQYEQDVTKEIVRRYNSGEWRNRK